MARSHRPIGSTIANFDATELSKDFENLMRSKRFNDFQQQHWQSRSRTASPALSQSTLSTDSTQTISTLNRRLPIMPRRPHDNASVKFCNLLHVLSVTPTKYENPGLLDEALTVIPLDHLYSEAEDEHQIHKARYASMGKKPQWGYQDFVIRSLLKWFKKSFFTWVNNPQCSKCLMPTIAHGMVPPTPDETARGATRVEGYKCSGCGALERFPRYSDVWQLLQTRCGRGGEWANCFTMLCRALGSRVRWVWNSEDYVWTEVYSEHQRRWVHVDACEGVWDQPRLYTEGWNRKLSYCIAFSIDGATDVTRRYVRSSSKHGSPRTRVTEDILLWAIYEIRKLRREKLTEQDHRRLRKEDEREERELRMFTTSALAAELTSLFPGSRRSAWGDEQKTPLTQDEDAAQWINGRPQNESESQGPNSRDTNR
ncbi:Protein png1 [Talaromyces marneffei ATCC 18224]|uniref:Protein PNG1 n=2 Tax=Talaromyces marneffei TaxID=37727 RepID=B6QLI4_TALMQ|nr:peptidase (PNG1), putative [Talaromyces marneffei ATCC 18224]KAE8550573.1 hypothetical protein EYB25_006801 [Talaromyces marneffei]